MLPFWLHPTWSPWEKDGGTSSLWHQLILVHCECLLCADRCFVGDRIQKDIHISDPAGICERMWTLCASYSAS